MNIEIHYNEEGKTFQKLLEEFVITVYRKKGQQ